MTCAICKTIAREGLNEQQINEELKGMYLGIGRKRVGTPKLAHYFNTAILENILKNKCREKNIEMPAVKISDLYETVRKVFASEEVSEEDYNLMSRVFSQCGIDINDIQSRFRTRVVMWQHIKNCLHIEIKKLSTEEFLKKANIRVGYFKDNLEYLLDHAVQRGVGGEGASFYPMIVAVCKNCERSYPVEEFMRKGFKCECVKEEGR